MKIRTFTINPNNPRTVAGSRFEARRTFETYGLAVWLRACGTKATILYRDEDGRARQKTTRFERLAFSEPPRPLTRA